MRNRATRRAAARRAKAHARFVLRRWGHEDPDADVRRLGKVARSPAICSCASCCNARGNYGPTIQERRHAMGVPGTKEEDNDE